MTARFNLNDSSFWLKHQGILKYSAYSCKSVYYKFCFKLIGVKMFHLDVKMIHETFFIAYETFVASFFVIPLYICNRILKTIINNLII